MAGSGAAGLSRKSERLVGRHGRDEGERSEGSTRSRLTGSPSAGWRLVRG
jgi:hypothetical protein